MPVQSTFPYLAKATVKYKSPHKQDLTFAKGETIRVTGVAPKAEQDAEDDDDDDDWLVGETLDGSRSGIFPGSFVEPTNEADEQTSHTAEAVIASATSAPSEPGAIPTEAPAGMQSSVLEEAATHQAETVPAAARQAAQKGETEQTGFGAPLPPRPPSADPDAEETPGASNAQRVSTQVDTGAPTEVDSKEKPLSASDEHSDGSKNAAAGDGVATSLRESPQNDANSGPSTEETKSDPVPAKSPPVVTTKPAGMSSSFRDRLAAFNKPAESAPPPLPKGKPGGWKRPAPTSDVPKPVLPAAQPSASSNVKVPADQQTTDAKEAPLSAEPSSTHGAFSAADAQSSIKMSLKERMAALQRNEAPAADATPSLKPKAAAPGKIGAERRNAALQGMGLAPGASVVPRKSSIDSSRETDETSLEPTGERGSPEQDKPVVPAEQSSREASETMTGEAADAEDSPETLEEPRESSEAPTEEQQEAERRAAIAKRMAALGARRMGGAPVPFGAPAPPNRRNTATSVESAEGTSSEPGIGLPAEPSTAAIKEEAGPAVTSSSAEAEQMETLSPSSQDAADEPTVLAVPRRTAAPRKKKPAPEAAAAAAPAAVTGPATDEVSDASPSVPEAELGASADVEDANTVEADHTPTVKAVSASHVGDTAAEPPHVGQSVGVPAEVEGVEKVRKVEEKQVEAADEEQVEIDPEIAENQRQLEEYLRGEGFYEEQDEPTALKPELAASAADMADDAIAPAAETEADPVRAFEIEQEEENTSPKPPSRTASIRPSIPKSTVPPPITMSSATDHKDAAPTRVQSPPTSANVTGPPRPSSVAPPVPTASLPVPMGSTAPEQSANTNEMGEEPEASGPVLAAPRPRMAIASEDPEDEVLLAAAAADADAPAAMDQPTEQPQTALQAEPEEVQLTEEEQEAQRRANLARRMAALGGQRMGAFPGMAPPPIMRAPMPPRKAPVQLSDDFENQATEAVAPEARVASERPTSPAVDSTEVPVRLASPPPLPTSPPPKPTSPPPPGRPLPAAGDATSPPLLPPGRPSSTVPMANLDEAIRAASPDNSSLSRHTSFKPPVPQGIGAHSRDTSATVGEQELSEDRELATSPPPLPVSPPPLPVSPPPRPSSRAPPVPGHASVPPRRQGSSASYASHGEVAGVPSTTATPSAEVPTSPTPTPRTEAALPPIPSSSAPAPSSNINIGARQSSRDLDLMPSSRWWRHGTDPLRLPPTVAGRPDAILYADTSSNANTGVPIHKADIYMLFEDYSTTTISLSFQDDDLDETHTSLTQRHNFPPAKPGAAELRQWSSSIGAAIAKLAGDAAKQSHTPVGDGSARAFVSSVLSQIPDALPPVGSSFGALILTQVGPTIMESSPDEVRPGDIVSCSQADFRGKKGLAPYHMTFAISPGAEPTTGIVVEVESKKNKLRCIVQSPTTNKKGLPDEVSLRLDDLKSGIVKVFRVPPRQGWLNDW